MRRGCCARSAGDSSRRARSRAATTTSRSARGGAEASDSDAVPRGRLTVVGTGYRATEHTTPEARRAIRGADRVLHLMVDHFSELWIEELNPASESLADAYGEGKRRGRTYDEMAERILAPVREGLTVCAVFYGHPGVFVAPSRIAIQRARDEGHAAEMLPAISAEDCLYADLGVDPGKVGCQAFEATDFLLRRRPYDPASALVLWQIGLVGVQTWKPERMWSSTGLRVLTEVLLESYPADHPAVVYETAPLPGLGPEIQRLELSDLPTADVSVSSTLYLAPYGVRHQDPEMRLRLGMEPKRAGADRPGDGR